MSRSIITWLFLTFALAIAGCQNGADQSQQPKFQSTKVYLFRGLLGHKYSTGLDTLGQRLEGNGHKVKVLSHNNEENVYWEIINSGHKQVALIGHSMGGKTATRLATKLARKGVKICLLATIDPVGNGLVPTNVAIALNWYQGRFSPLIAGKGFAGYIQNFKMDGWRHIDLDEANVIHNRVATVLGSRCR